MKKLAIAANALLAVLAISSLASCSSNSNTNDSVEASAVKGNDSVAAVAPQINIRFINEDTISANYNLAKDFKEQAIREYSKLENARQARANEIQKFGAQIEQKMKSNGYLSEASYNADMAKINKMQEDAQNYLPICNATPNSSLQHSSSSLQTPLMLSSKNIMPPNIMMQFCTVLPVCISIPLLILPMKCLKD